MHRYLNAQNYDRLDGQYDQNDGEEEVNLNNELNIIAIQNSFNLFNTDQLNLLKTLNTNQNFKNLFLNSSAPLDDKLNFNSLVSLNSPVSINSPTASLNNQPEDDHPLSSTALSTNQLNNQDDQIQIDKLDTPLAVGDQYIIDNRKNINQNRIKSSILGAAKHLNKKQQLDLDLNNNDTAINLSIHSLNEQQQTKAKKCTCEICGQSFTQRNSLNRHIRGHTGILIIYFILKH